MENNNKLKEIDIKKCTCHYFDDIINVNGVDIVNILLDKKSLENFSIYDGAYKTPNGTKPFRIIFDKVEECIRKYDSTKYLALFHFNEKYE